MASFFGILTTVRPIEEFKLEGPPSRELSKLPSREASLLVQAAERATEVDVSQVAGKLRNFLDV